MQTISSSNIVLRTSGLTKHFDDLTAVDNLNLEVYQGEIFGLLGPNGAGKSTSINMICGLIRPDAGQILINDIATDPSSKSRKKFGLCPQEVIIWPKLTCLEQLIFIGEMYGMPTRIAEKSGRDLLLRLGLDEKTNKLAGTLSGGMKRRLNICLALVHDPEIVILDEPEAGLDPQSKVMVRDFIRSLRKSKTVILTTHNMDEADRLSDRVAIIDNGKLLLTDTPENLKKTLGSGDVLEIIVRNDDRKDLTKAAELLQTLSGKVTISGDCILLREKNAIELIPAITSKLQEGDFLCTEIKMRANTLEDVFIQLTGRRLRE
jgi:ABC-2 type transport system ATP-binding protein